MALISWAFGGVQSRHLIGDLVGRVQCTNAPFCGAISTLMPQDDTKLLCILFTADDASFYSYPLPPVHLFYSQIGVLADCCILWKTHAFYFLKIFIE